MKNLRNKTFYTIFTIISFIGLFFVIFFNVQVYQREYSGILNSITRMRNFISNDVEKLPRNLSVNTEEPRNRIIMEYDVYTFVLDSYNHIIGKISYGDSSLDLTVLEKAEEILQKASPNEIKIGNLYTSSFAYHFVDAQFLTIVNIASSRNYLLKEMLLSLILFFLGEIVNCLISKKITDWITEPVALSFQRQKEFVANASHELKTPLAVMIASIDCLKTTKENEKWIHHLKSESERMNHLITRLLDLSQSEDSLSKEEFQWIDFSKVVEKRSLIFESLAFEKKVQMKTEIQEHIQFLCHQESMDELVSILIDNAIHHSIQKGQIIVRLTKIKNEIQLEVINQGDEIPEEECERIFDRFYRNDQSHNRKSNRYGLGLAIAKNIVDAHHGTITAQSKNGYTTLRVIFKTKGR